MICNPSSGVPFTNPLNSLLDNESISEQTKQHMNELKDLHLTTQIQIQTQYPFPHSLSNPISLFSVSFSLIYILILSVFFKSVFLLSNTAGTNSHFTHDPDVNTLLLFEGHAAIHSLFDFLLNFNGYNDELPLLYSNTPFVNSTLKQIQMKTNGKVLRQVRYIN